MRLIALYSIKFNSLKLYSMQAYAEVYDCLRLHSYAVIVACTFTILCCIIFSQIFLNAAVNWRILWFQRYNWQIYSPEVDGARAKVDTLRRRIERAFD